MPVFDIVYVYWDAVLQQNAYTEAHVLKGIKQ